MIYTRGYTRARLPCSSTPPARGPNCLLLSRCTARLVCQSSTGIRLVLHNKQLPAGMCAMALCMPAPKKKTKVAVSKLQLLCTKPTLAVSPTRSVYTTWQTLMQVSRLHQPHVSESNPSCVNVHARHDLCVDLHLVHQAALPYRWSARFGYTPGWITPTSSSSLLPLRMMPTSTWCRSMPQVCAH